MANSDSTNQLQSNCPASTIDWGTTGFLVATPLIALIGMPLYVYFAGISWSLLGVFVFYLAATGFSITAGYHRLFAHRSYDANRFIKLLFLVFGAAACENSALKWATDHRYHHRFVDQSDDPYNIRRGFLLRSPATLTWTAKVIYPKIRWCVGSIVFIFPLQFSPEEFHLW